MIFAWRCLPSRSWLWKEVAIKERLISVASPLSRRRLYLRLEFMMTLISNHMPHIKHFWIASRTPPCWLKGWLSKLLFSIWTFPNGSPPRIGNTFYPTLKIRMKSLWKNFIQNALFDEDKLRCWVRGKDFIVMPSYLAIILNINWLVFIKPLVYDELEPDLGMLQDALGENLVISSNGKAISMSSLSLELRLLTTIMFHNLYPLSSTGYLNLGRALFLHDLITDEEIDICSHIFHILGKTTERTTSRNCLPFCWNISKILKFKGVHTLEDEYPYPKQSPINIRTLNAIISHSRKNVKQESNAPQSDTSSSSHFYDKKLDNINGIYARHQHQIFWPRIYHALLAHPIWQKVHLSPNSIGLNPKEARRRWWQLAIPWQKGGDDVHERGRAMIRGKRARSKREQCNARSRKSNSLSNFLFCCYY